MQPFSKNIETVTTITIAFNKEEILKSDKWLEWIEAHPKLAKEAKEVLDAVADWINESEQENISPDFYYKPNETLPMKGDWGVDDSFSAECETWENARQQMGTTGMKFSITNFLKIPHDRHMTKSILELGKFFKSLGFICFFAFYNQWRLGYDYELCDIDTDLKELKEWFRPSPRPGLDPKTTEPTWYEAHICLSIPIVKTTKKTIIRPI